MEVLDQKWEAMKNKLTARMTRAMIREHTIWLYKTAAGVSVTTDLMVAGTPVNSWYALEKYLEQQLGVQQIPQRDMDKLLSAVAGVAPWEPDFFDLAGVLPKDWKLFHFKPLRWTFYACQVFEEGKGWAILLSLDGEAPLVWATESQDSLEEAFKRLWSRDIEKRGALSMDQLTALVFHVHHECGGRFGGAFVGEG